ncbi:MAG: hypothetical protein RL755_1418 [Pseudomonadota bacterium]|jgi:RNA polymerase sigma factor (sigma-70 family)
MLSFKFNQLFVQHAHEVKTFISTRWSKEQDVSDIVQETFLRFWQYPNPEKIKNPRAFLLQTASNLAIDRYRHNKIRHTHIDFDAELDGIIDHLPSPDKYVEVFESLELFNQWLEELPILRRHAFVLYRIEGLSHAEISKRLGISTRCSERYVGLAMQHISKKISEHTD